MCEDLVRIYDIRDNVQGPALVRSVTEAVCSQTSNGLLTNWAIVVFLRRPVLHGVMSHSTPQDILV
jgi:hypothetical protein